MATVTNTGYLTDIQNLSIDGASWTPLSIVANNVLIHSRSNHAIKISLDPAGATYFTIPGNQSLTVDANSNSKEYYLQGTGADTVEIIVTDEG